MARPKQLSQQRRAHYDEPTLTGMCESQMSEVKATDSEGFGTDFANQSPPVLVQMGSKNQGAVPCMLPLQEGQELGTLPRSLNYVASCCSNRETEAVGGCSDQPASRVFTTQAAALAGESKTPNLKRYKASSLPTAVCPFCSM